MAFPGQGSQVPGMAAAWRDLPSFERWAQADEILGRDVTHLGLRADADELRRPANCQVALFVHHTVLFEAWREAGGNPSVTAGHSLGEYNALLAARVLDFGDALRLVDARARHTDAAAAERPGTMIACLGFESGVVEGACEGTGAHVANDNAPGQVTVSGSRQALDAVKANLADAKGKVRDLEVGAAYHSPHMEPALEPFGQALDAAPFAPAAVNVIANVDARPHTDGWPELLRRQLVSPVRWRESVETMTDLGVRRVVELAATSVLGGMIKRIDRQVERVPITLPEDLVP